MFDCPEDTVGPQCEPYFVSGPDFQEAAGAFYAAGAAPPLAEAELLAGLPADLDRAVRAECFGIWALAQLVGRVVCLTQRES